MKGCGPVSVQKNPVCAPSLRLSLQQTDTTTSMHFSWPAVTDMLSLSLSLFFASHRRSTPRAYTHTQNRLEHAPSHTPALSTKLSPENPQKPSVSPIHSLIQNGISIWADGEGRETLKWIKESRKWVNECRKKLLKACNSAFSLLIMAAPLPYWLREKRSTCNGIALHL